VFRAYGPGPSLWDSMLPAEALRMPAELARADTTVVPATWAIPPDWTEKPWSGGQEPTAANGLDGSGQLRG
jgi:hypothetical protein